MSKTTVDLERQILYCKERIADLQMRLEKINKMDPTRFGVMSLGGRRKSSSEVIDESRDYNTLLLSEQYKLLAQLERKLVSPNLFAYWLGEIKHRLFGKGLYEEVTTSNDASCLVVTTVVDNEGGGEITRHP